MWQHSNSFLFTVSCLCCLWGWQIFSTFLYNQSLLFRHPLCRVTRFTAIIYLSSTPQAWHSVQDAEPLLSLAIWNIYHTWLIIVFSHYFTFSTDAIILYQACLEWFPKHPFIHMFILNVVFTILQLFKWSLL